MKIAVLSDTHNIYDFANAPDADLLIIAGDILMQGSIKELQQVMLQLDMESHRWKHILIVPGNHDFALEKFINSSLSWEEFAKDYEIIYYPSNMTISHEGLVEILDLKIFTWAWVPNLPNWAFHMPDHDMKEYCEKFDMPDKVDILVSHGPPRGILDLIPKYGQVGSRSMLKVFNFAHNIHVFGHIHENYGYMLRNKSNKINTDNAEYRKFYNVSILNEQYIKENKPITFEV